MDVQEERLERLRARRDTLAAAGMPRTPEEAEIEQEIAEAERQSLTGSGSPRTDTRPRPLEGAEAHRYARAMLGLAGQRFDARRVLADARSGGARALARLRLAASGIRAVAAHASVSVAPRRRGRVRAPGRARRGPARAAPARPRPAFGA